jgi:hypothetical protein
MAKAHSTWGTYSLRSKVPSDLVMVHKTLNGQCPLYLRDLLIEKQGLDRTRSLVHNPQDNQWPRPRVPDMLRDLLVEKQGSPSVNNFQDFLCRSGALRSRYGRCHSSFSSRGPYLWNGLSKNILERWHLAPWAWYNHRMEPMNILIDWSLTSKMLLRLPLRRLHSCFYFLSFTQVRAKPCRREQW